MAGRVLLTLEQIEAANRLHEQLAQWRRSDCALEALKNNCPDFGADSTLLKVVAVNSLYGTNVYATLRVAAHIEGVMSEIGRVLKEPELVELLANVPVGGSEKKPIRRYSFASKFSNFFIDTEVFPILDSYAEKMVRLHLGRKGLMCNPRKPYLAFVENFERLVEMVGHTGTRRSLDRYLWLARQFRAWRKNQRAKINTECRALFERNPPELQRLIGAVD